MTMKQLTTHEIAAALAGHPNDPSAELRLLMHFQSEPSDRAEVEPETPRQALPRAA